MSIRPSPLEGVVSTCSCNFEMCQMLTSNAVIKMRVLRGCKVATTKKYNVSDVKQFHMVRHLFLEYKQFEHLIKMKFFIVLNLKTIYFPL